jgi:hypothetical protein
MNDVVQQRIYRLHLGEYGNIQYSVKYRQSHVLLPLYLRTVPYGLEIYLKAYVGLALGTEIEASLSDAVYADEESDAASRK